MKKRNGLLLGLAFLPVLLGAQSPGHFIVKGEFSNAVAQWIHLSYTDDDGRLTEDSARVKNGHFLLEGSIDHPVQAELWTRPFDAQHNLVLWLEAATLLVQVDERGLQHASVKGSATQKEYEQFRSLRKPIFRKYKPWLDSLQHARNAQQAAALRERLYPYYREMEKAEQDFFETHPQSYITASQLSLRVNEITAPVLKKYYERLGPELQSGTYGRILRETIERVLAGTPGTPAYAFNGITAENRLIRLEDYKGRYLLVDFWASWCVPCRKSNPHLRALYNAYKANGIEFIGIADDDDHPEAWKNAIFTDSLPWPQLLRGKNKAGADINKKYGVNGLPVKILVDPDGMVIGRYEGDDEAMETQLKKLFGH